VCRGTPATTGGREAVCASLSEGLVGGQVSGSVEAAHRRLGFRGGAVTASGCENLAPKWSGTAEEPAVV
jgi:hypothetical protein